MPMLIAAAVQVGVPHVGPQELDTAQIVPELVLVPQPLLALTRLW